MQQDFTWSRWRYLMTIWIIGLTIVCSMIGMLWMKMHRIGIGWSSVCSCFRYEVIHVCTCSDLRGYSRPVLHRRAEAGCCSAFMGFYFFFLLLFLFPSLPSFSAILMLWKDFRQSSSPVLSPFSHINFDWQSKRKLCSFSQSDSKFEGYSHFLSDSSSRNHTQLRWVFGNRKAAKVAR